MVWETINAPVPLSASAVVRSGRAGQPAEIGMSADLPAPVLHDLDFRVEHPLYLNTNGSNRLIIAIDAQQSTENLIPVTPLQQIYRGIQNDASLHIDGHIGRNYVINLLIFHAGGLDCAFPLEAVQEIVPMATLFSPPGLPSGLAGFLNLRGTAVPILRLDRLLELPERQPGLHAPLIVLRGASGSNYCPTGVLVDFVRAIVPMPSTSLLAIPEDDTFRGCATAALELDGDRVHLLSAAALLDVNEIRSLADYTAMAQARLLRMEQSGMEPASIEEGV